ncbi:MAG TPA: hypothetical protein VEI52_01435 [Terriglobales bacterium]|nr:hypothetical protein [Terriglobales bacterium]
MAASQVVLYFAKQEDALMFTLAASSAMSADGAMPAHEVGIKMAEGISKATRITTEGELSVARSDRRRQSKLGPSTS